MPVYRILFSIVLLCIGFISYQLILGRDLSSVDWLELLYLVLFLALVQVIGTMIRNRRSK
jgi:hypothetical protein